MHAIVVLDSLHGNTERVADVIGEALGALGEVRVVRTTDLPPDVTADIWVVGGPTHGHGISKPLVAFVDRLRGASLRGVPVATFDTRNHYPRLARGFAERSFVGLRPIARKSVQRGRRFGPVAVTSLWGTQSSTCWNPWTRPPSSSTDARSESR